MTDRFLTLWLIPRIRDTDYGKIVGIQQYGLILKKSHVNFELLGLFKMWYIYGTDSRFKTTR